MRVSVTDEDGVEYNYDFSQEVVLLGRGASCDIVIQSDHISRKHLKISLKEGVIFIQDLTLSNWVSYNDEKLAKNTDIQYFDFAPLVLPGGIHLKIGDHEPEQEEFNLSNSIRGIPDPALEKNKKVREKLDIYNTRLSADIIHEGDNSARKKAKEEAKKERSEQRAKEMRIMLLAFLILSAGIVTFYYDELTGAAPPKKIAKPAPKKTPKVVKKRKNKKPKLKSPSPVKQIVKETVFEKDFKILNRSNDKCAKGYYENLCTMVFETRSQREGVLIKNGEVHVLKEYKTRLARIYKNKNDLMNKAMGEEGVLEFVAAEKIMQRQVLKKIESSRVTKIKIYVYVDNPGGDRLRAAYELDPGIYRRFSDRDWQYANKQVQQKVDFKYFNSKFARYLQEGYKNQ